MLGSFLECGAVSGAVLAGTKVPVGAQRLREPVKLMLRRQNDTVLSSPSAEEKKKSERNATNVNA